MTVGTETVHRKVSINLLCGSKPGGMCVTSGCWKQLGLSGNAQDPSNCKVCVSGVPVYLGMSVLLVTLQVGLVE